MALLHDMRTIKNLLTVAEREAHDLGDEQPGAEHWCWRPSLSTTGPRSSSSGSPGSSSGQRSRAVHATALEGLGIAPPAGPHPGAEARGVYRSSDSAQEVFQRARVLAKDSRPAGLLGRHVVLAALEREHGTVARAIAVLGLDRAALLP